ncbi:LAETG motif-containing sortase-dependent surface protein [Streptomyces peucetius]|uniref:LPXTG cell wall anchor domain-containing protein n=1 Tax=Streptomyces peucetius TaxID=1950 RepID=A0ABY6I9Y6_STRPE|nr:LAETG motif-containing sortase-dependent surface protein [Streptomyces peucetius]UYQ63823.1 LPXTG cell wall anchor domain-containing protein [Streptomyces peucetius]
MKLRRALAVAAATAVIAPATFLAAPAAYATISSTPIASETDTDNPGTEDPEGEKSEATTPDTTTPDSTVQDGDKPDATTPDDTTDGDTTTPDDTTDGDEPDTTTPDDTKDGDKPDTTPDDDDKPDTETPGDEDPEEEFPPYCEELDENFEEKALGLKLSGLPAKIVAGSGWEDFNLTITNNSKADLKEVAFYAEVENYELDEDKWLSKHVELQFRLPGTDQWERIGNETYAGDYFWGVETMKSQDFVKIDLRVSIAKEAPAGDSYAIGSGGYLGDVEGQECIAESAGAWADFTVLKPGSSNENPGEAKPGEGKPEDKGPDPKPQGGVKELPVTGNLAETGSDSSLPVIGAVGGVAILAGAGAVFAMKRRRGDATA